MNVDMTTRYLGLELTSPIAVSAGPMSDDLEMLRRLEGEGAGLAVLPSLFQEQIEHEQQAMYGLFQVGADSFGEALSYFPEQLHEHSSSDEYLRKIDRAKCALTMPIVASLNGSSKAGWQLFARQMQEAGADALEINIYHVPVDADITSAEVEQRYVDLLQSVWESVNIPVAIKIGPYFTALPHLAHQLQTQGARGLVLFNRYLAPEIDLHTLTVKPHLELSTPAELLLRLRWIAILRQQVEMSLALTGGIHSSSDALKGLLVGADVVMMQSALLLHGPGLVGTMLREMEEWLVEHDYESVQQMQGSLCREHAENPAAFERSNYVQAVLSFARRIDE